MRLSPLSLPVLLLAGTTAYAQKSFDVATIKPNSENDHRIMLRVQPGGRFTATGVTVKLLISQAYNVRDFQITNAPGWISAERFDISAKAEGLPERVPPEQLRPLLQSLLVERFGLKTHDETKEMPVYALTVAKGGPKLTASNPETQGPQMRMAPNLLDGKKIPMTMFAQQIAQRVGRSVIDKTELKDSYDIKLEWTPDPGQGGGPGGGIPPSADALTGAGGSGPSIFTALQEQLGLKLESSKGPVQILVIDNVAKPSEN